MALHINWWTPSTVTTNEVTTFKSKETWSKDESTLVTVNFKALNTIFASVDTNKFKLISFYECTRDAWTIL